MKDDILALTKLKRSRNNLARIQDQLGEVGELAEAADVVNSLAAAVWEAVEELTGADGSGNPMTPWFDDAVEAANLFQQSLPQEGAESVGDLVSEAEQAAEEYESCLEDRDYTADDREEVWGNLLDALSNIADAM
jgi:hypothetical protein